MSTQNGQFVPTVGRETSSVGWGWPTKYNAYYLTLHDTNATQFTVKQSSYINATGYLIEWLTCLLLYVSANTNPDPHTRFDIISLGVEAVLSHDQDTCKTVRTCVRSKIHSTISWIISSQLPMNGFKDSTDGHQQKTIDTTVPTVPTVPLPMVGAQHLAILAHIIN